MLPPINLYYLLCYAWDVLPPTGTAPAESVAAGPDSPALRLLTHLLVQGLTQRARRGVPAAYAPVRATERGLRGTLDVAALARRPALALSGRLPGRQLVLSADTPPARLFVTALRRLLTTDRAALNSSHRAQIRAHLAPLAAVPEVAHPTPADFRAATRAVPPTDTATHLALRAAELLLFNLVPTPDVTDTTRTTFHDFTADEVQMGALFEAFVRNFLRREQRHATVSADTLRWRGATAATAEALALLPVMRTDVTLTSPTRRLVIDTKYYLRALPPGRFNAPRLIAPHLYQLLAYLRNQPTAPSQTVEGLLLYPVTAHTPPLRLEYRLDGYRLRVRTLDLRRPWSQISQELLAAVAIPAMDF